MTIVYCSWKNHVFGLYPLFNVSKNTVFQKLDPFPSSGKIMAPNLLGRLERASLYNWTGDGNISGF
jgi:hypothetical protein